MQMKRMKKALSLLLCMVLIVAMALVTTGCSGNAEKETAAQTTEAATEAAQETAGTETEAQTATAAESADVQRVDDVTVLGEGSKMFDFSVVDLEGKETWFEIHTDEEIVGAALLAVDLIAGDDGPYGLYVKEVNGITADYDKDKTYWAFYVNDEYGTSGVDTTVIEEGTVYSFHISK